VLFQRDPDKPRLTVFQQRAFYHAQFPKGLPHSGQGVKYAKYICRTMAFLPNDRRAQWLDRHAAWISPETRRSTAAWRWSIRWCGRDKPRYAKMASLSVFGVGRQQFGRARITIIPGRVIRHIGNGQLPLSKQVARIHGAGQAIEKSGRIFRLRT
jgi:hypothetical protein